MDPNNRLYTFLCDCWIQNDQPADDSRPSWTIYSAECYWSDPIPNCADVVRVSCQQGKCDRCDADYILQGDVCTREYYLLRLSWYSLDTRLGLKHIYLYNDDLNRNIKFKFEKLNRFLQSDIETH